jgi:hypothetical protein
LQDMARDHGNRCDLKWFLKTILAENE